MEDEDNVMLPESEEYASLQELLQQQHGSRSQLKSLSEQISTSSTTSLDKLRKLSKKLQKTFGPTEIDATELDSSSPSSVNGVTPTEKNCSSSPVVAVASAESKIPSMRVSFEIDKETNV